MYPHCIFFGINPHVSKHHAFRLNRATVMTLCHLATSQPVMLTSRRHLFKFSEKNPMKLKNPPWIRHWPVLIKNQH